MRSEIKFAFFSPPRNVDTIIFINQIANLATLNVGWLKEIMIMAEPYCTLKLLAGHTRWRMWVDFADRTGLIFMTY